MNKELLKQYNNLYNQTERKELIAFMLTQFRELNGLQKKEVAELIGIKPQTYGAYESGRNETPAEVLVRLSFLYDVPVDVLIQRDNTSKTELSAQEQLAFYDEQIQELKEQLLKGSPEAQAALSQLVEGIEELNNSMKKATSQDN